MTFIWNCMMKIYFRQILSFAQVWPIKLKQELKHATGIPKRRLRVLVLQIQHKTLQQGPVDGGLGFRSMCIKMMLATGRPRRRSGLLELSNIPFSLCSQKDEFDQIVDFLINFISIVTQGLYLWGRYESNYFSDFWTTVFLFYFASIN